MMASKARGREPLPPPSDARRPARLDLAGELSRHDQSTREMIEAGRQRRSHGRQRQTRGCLFGILTVWCLFGLGSLAVMQGGWATRLALDAGKRKEIIQTLGRPFVRETTLIIPYSVSLYALRDGGLLYSGEKRWAEVNLDQLFADGTAHSDAVAIHRGSAPDSDGGQVYGLLSDRDPTTVLATTSWTAWTLNGLRQLQREDALPDCLILLYRHQVEGRQSGLYGAVSPCGKGYAAELPLTDVRVETEPWRPLAVASVPFAFAADVLSGPLQLALVYLAGLSQSARFP